jgi:hypothetical protein
MGEWMYRSTYFFTSALVGGEWAASRLGRFTLEERAPGTHWIGRWVGPRTSLDDVEKRKMLPLPGLELQPLSRPAHGQGLYRLRHAGSYIIPWIPKLDVSFIYNAGTEAVPRHPLYVEGRL